MKHLKRLLILTGSWLTLGCMSYAEVACKQVEECDALGGDPFEQCVVRFENLVPKDKQAACAACFEAKGCRAFSNDECSAKCFAPEPGTPPAEVCVCPAEYSPGQCYAPRDPEEWQGYLQDACTREPCNDFGSCGAARACLPGSQCGACVVDTDCLAGEVCVLDNCLLPDRVECRTRKDCDPDRVCMIAYDGAAATWRGNAGLVAGCSNSELIRNAH